MPGTMIDVREAQTQLMQLLTLALNGGDIVIAKDNVPLVRLVPVKPQKKGRTAGYQLELAETWAVPIHLTSASRGL